MTTSVNFSDQSGAATMPSNSLMINEALAREMLLALEKLHGLNVGCVGDIMIDVDVSCVSARVSPEAPVMVLAENEQQARLGGVGNVAANVAALGCRTTLCGLIGQDDDGAELAQLIASAGITFSRPDMMVPSRPTTRKKRIISGGQQLLRIDREVSRSPDALEIAHLTRMINDLPSPLHCLLVSDYGKGVVGHDTMAPLRTLAEREQCPILVDPKGRDWQRYGTVDIIKPNASELATLTGSPCENDQQVGEALSKALHMCSARMILVTRAGDGASLIMRETNEVRHFAARRVHVADVCGAGDTNLAVLGAMLAAGLGIDHAIMVAQLASSLAVQRRGNDVVSSSDLKRIAKSASADLAEDKVMSIDALMKQVMDWRSHGLVVGLTNGCFDLVHAGHIRMLQHLRENCDRVVVALNSDHSVRRLKGKTRPIVGQDERAALLAAMSAVDAVIIFDTDTPRELILQIKPDVLCKGGDYRPEEIVGADIVEKNGGRVLVSDLAHGLSTTNILKKITGNQGEDYPYGIGVK